MSQAFLEELEQAIQADHARHARVNHLYNQIQKLSEERDRLEDIVPATRAVVQKYIEERHSQIADEANV